MVPIATYAWVTICSILLAAVKAATWNPAQALGCLGEVGSIANGKRADFVVCGRDFARKAVYLDGEEVCAG